MSLFLFPNVFESSLKFRNILNNISMIFYQYLILVTANAENPVTYIDRIYLSKVITFFRALAKSWFCSFT